MSLPKYKYLLTYRYAEIIQDLTVEFCKKYIDYKSRTRDQMIQSGRSGKQNIVEAVGESDTTKKGEIKLLGISKGSFEELLSNANLPQNRCACLAFPRDRLPFK